MRCCRSGVIADNGATTRLAELERLCLWLSYFCCLVAFEQGERWDVSNPAQYLRLTSVILAWMWWVPGMFSALRKIWLRDEQALRNEGKAWTCAHGTSSSVSQSRPQAFSFHGSLVQQGVSVPCAETPRGPIAKDVSVLWVNHAASQNVLFGVRQVSQAGVGLLSESSSRTG